MKEWLKNKKLYQTVVLVCLMLLWPEWKIGGMSVRAWLLYLAVLTGGIRLYRRRQPGEGGKRDVPFLGWLSIVYLAVDFFYVLARAVCGRDIPEPCLTSLFLLLFAALVSVEWREWRAVLAQTVLLCAFFVYLGLLWHFLAVPDAVFFLGGLLADQKALVSFLVFVNVLAAEEYYRRKDEMERYFCFLVVLMGFFILLIQKDPMGILLMSSSFFFSLVLHEPRKALVERVALLALVWFLCLSNMCLITNYTSLIKVECQYSLEGSVYLELAVACACAVFLFRWDKFKETDGNPLRYDIQALAGKLLAGVCVALFLLLTMGERLSEMAGESGVIPVLAGWAAALAASVKDSHGVFYDIMSRWGVAGGIWMVMFWVSAAAALWRRIKRKRIEFRRAVPAILWLMQIFFFSIQAVSAPFYAIVFGLALPEDSFGKK